MIYFCEVNKCGGEHASINSKLLNMVHDFLPLAGINCYMCRDHWVELNKFGKYADYADFKKVSVIGPSPRNKIRWITKIVVECLTILNVLWVANKAHVRFVFFSSVSPFSNFFLHGLLRLFTRVKVVIVVHGELQLLNQSNSKLVDRIYAFCLRNVFKKEVANRKFLVLSDLVKHRLTAEHHFNEAVILAIPHPYSESFRMDQITDTEKSDKITIGYIGTAKLVKDTHLFFRLASFYKEQISAGNVLFLISGQVFPDLYPFVNRWVEYSETDGFVDHQQYVERCLRMDYVIFFNSEENYGMISSGALMDAVALGIPIIALRTKAFEYLFGLCKHAPGILCDDFTAMKNEIDNILEKGGPLCVNYVEGMKELQKYFADERIQKEFNKQMEYLLD